MPKTEANPPHSQSLLALPSYSVFQDTGLKSKNATGDLMITEQGKLGVLFLVEPLIDTNPSFCLSFGLEALKGREQNLLDSQALPVSAYTLPP